MERDSGDLPCFHSSVPEVPSLPLLIVFSVLLMPNGAFPESRVVFKEDQRRISPFHLVLESEVSLNSF